MSDLLLLGATLLASAGCARCARAASLGLGCARAALLGALTAVDFATSDCCWHDV